MSQWICSQADQYWQDRSSQLTDEAAPGFNVGARRDQPILGFGGCFNELGWHALQQTDAGQRDGVIRALFDPDDGCRFRFCRAPIGASDYAMDWYSCDEVDGDYALDHFSIERDRRMQLPYIEAAMAVQPEVELFVSPWSPPTWMKRPKVYNHGTLAWDEKTLDAYARYLLKFVEAYRAEGLAVRQVHVQNEPDSDQKFPSCVWTGGMLRDFIRDHLGPTFEKAGCDCEIWLGTIERPDFNAWVLTPLLDPVAAGYICGVGFQWAGRGAVPATHACFPDLPLMQTENECGDGRNDWSHAMHVFDLMHHYFTHGVRVYTYWNMVLPAGGVSTWGWRQNSMVTVDTNSGAVTYTPEFYVIKHAARFIDPGAVRREVEGVWSANAFAFENPDGGLVALTCNPFDHSQPVHVELGDTAFTANLPRLSVNTFVA
jgi:glucosylceramidase